MAVVERDELQRQAAGDWAGQVGAEVGAAVSSALERVRRMAEIGSIDRIGLLALEAELGQVREIAVRGQQLARLAGGQVQLAPERRELPQLLREAVAQRRERIAGHGVDVRQRLRPAAVAVDPSLLFSLLLGLVDWALDHARGRTLQLSTGVLDWPVRAQLRCGFDWRTPDRAGTGADDAASPPPMDGVAWQLVLVSAQALGVRVECRHEAWRTTVTLAFPEAPRHWASADEAAAASDDPWTTGERTLAGCHVLVLAASQALQRAVAEATAGLDLVLGIVPTLEAARASAEREPPDIVVVDTRGGAVEAWLLALEAGAGGPALLHLSDATQGIEISSSALGEVVCVGRDDAARDLAAALRLALPQA